MLTEGGYTHYREKMATELQEVAEWIRRECGADLNTVLHYAKLNGEGAEVKILVREKMKEIKGLGGGGGRYILRFGTRRLGRVGTIFGFEEPENSGENRVAWNADDLFRILKNSPVDMARLASALTVVRLEKREHEFE